MRALFTSRSIALMLALSGNVMQQAHAESVIKVCSNDGMCGTASALKNEQMAGVLGKFMAAGEVVGMNLIMTSSWQAPGGQRLEGLAQISFELPNSGHTRASYSAHALVSESQATMPSVGTTSSTVHAGRLNETRGVTQLTQVAGDGNAAFNRTSIEISNNPISIQSSNNVSNISASGSNGAQAIVSVGKAGVNLQLRMPDTGIAQQKINIGTQGAIHQSIQIAADRQQVVNQLHLQVHMRPLSHATSSMLGVARSLNMLRGH